MLGATQADALGTEVAGALSVIGGVGVRTDLHPSRVICVPHDAEHRVDELVVARGLLRRVRPPT